MIEKPAKPLRTCRVCGLEAYTEENLKLFRVAKTKPYGRCTICKTCQTEWNKRYYQNNRKKIDERKREYAKAHPEKMKAISKKSGKKYREANKEKIRERQRKYNEANSEKVKKRFVKRRRAHPFLFAARRLKTRCKHSGIDFDLELEWFRQRWEECGGICLMTGVKMKKIGDSNDPYTMSADRIDPKKGYTKDNVRLVSRWYNWVRNNWGDKFTLEMCQRVVECNVISNSPLICVESSPQQSSH